jgi:GNAT superfamily N-acetyltransferase
MIVAPASPGDAAVISTLHMWAERETYSTIFPTLLTNVSDLWGRIRIWEIAVAERRSEADCLLARDDAGSPVGFLAGRAAGCGAAARLSSIYVLRAHQRRGAGRRLLTAFAGAADAEGSETIAGYAPACNVGAREFVAWSGVLETSYDDLGCGAGHVRMVAYRWASVQRLLA